MRFLLLACLGLAACRGPADTPQGALETFFARTTAGDAEGARALLTKAERDDDNNRIDPKQLNQGYVLGSLDEDRDRACILVDQKGVRAPMRWVLRREDGCWRVCLHETAKASFGGEGPTGAAAALQKLCAQIQERASKQPLPGKPPAPGK